MNKIGWQNVSTSVTVTNPVISILFLLKGLLHVCKIIWMSNIIRRVMVGTDRSETADQAVQWAAGFADRYDAELFVVQVVVPQYPSATEFGEAEQTRAAADNNDLAHFARQVAGDRGHARVVIDADPALAIVRAAEQEAVDVLVVGNFGMAGRKEFLLGNIPNRISHSAHCTVIIVNTAHSTGEHAPDSVRAHLSNDTSPFEPRLVARATHIAAVMAKHGLTELFGQSNEPDMSIRRQRAKRLRAALEELG
ncbi:MAG: universal stress protein, partial [Polynucleobacter sp.]|nr:universal stress protein [Polynucleobacter sp.]